MPTRCRQIKVRKLCSTGAAGPSSCARSGGFTLFELVAFIIVAAIIYTVAVNRFSEFPEAAERANFQAVLTQIQAGINLEIMLGVSTGAIHGIQQYEGLNPMDLMLKTPSNYLGVFETSFTENLPRRTWYFDAVNRHLVYRVNESENVFLLRNDLALPADELRFHIIMTYRDPVTLKNVTYEELLAMSEDRDSAESAETRLAEARVSGAVLRAVTPYRWNSPELSLEDYAAAG